MSDGTEHKEPLDHFSSYLKGRLENHPSPVDPGSWDKIAGQLQRRKRSRLGWIASGTAAAILLAILWLSIPLDTENVQEQLAEQEILSRPVEEKPVTETTEPVVETLALQTPPPAPKLPSTQKSKAPVEEIEELIIETISPQEEDEGQIVDEQPTEVREQPTETREQPTESPKHPQKAKCESFTPSEPTPFADLPQKKKGGKWLLAVALGTGGGNPSLVSFSTDDNAIFQPSYNDPGYNIPSIPSVETDNEHLAEKKYVDISHAIPLSVGISVRKEISPVFAIESGLVYTYLASDLKKGWISKNDKLQLHYLGIPLNAVGYLVNKPRWNMYLSGGVMLEKGLKSVLTVRKFDSSEFISIAEKSSISGVQFSLHGAVGIAYHLFDHWSLYAEPKIYYYFDADQPVSIRTEHPFGFGVNGGIRYHF